jgi:hypothetical protein
VSRPPSARRALLQRRLLLTHAAITAAAGLALAVRPAAIPAAVGIRLPPEAYLLSYLLGAAEFGFATLSWLGAHSTELSAVRAAMLGCVVFHATSAAFEAIVWRSHPVPILLANILARLMIVGAFLALLPRRDDSGRPSPVPYDER